MAILARTDSPDTFHLRSRHLVGRSRLVHLRLDEARISGEHAVLAWTGFGWDVHDLGSTNGTYIDGVRLASGQRAPLVKGSVLAFGAPSLAFNVIDDGAPEAMAAPRSGGPPVVARGGILALPNDDSPEVTVYRAGRGRWVVDTASADTEVEDNAEIEVAGQLFTLLLPEPLPPTFSPDDAAPSIDAVTLAFQVSGDEEYVTLRAVHRGRDIDLGARAHHYLLLTLARARVRDRENQVPESSCGWLYHEQLMDMLDMDDKHINVAVYRCREQLGAAGVLGAPGIIERRKPTRQLRLGVSRVTIERI